MNTPPAPSDAPPDARIAVVIPVKGRTELLRDAVDSIRSQSLVDWEAIMVDDGSTHEELDGISGIITPTIYYPLTLWKPALLLLSIQ